MAKTKSNKLEAVFQTLGDKQQYLMLVKKRVCKITLGSSIIRAFASGTKPALLKGLDDIEVDDILNLNSQELYNEWHLKKIKSVYALLKKVDSNIVRHTKDGLKWGHATKIWNIYVGLLVFYSPYFKQSASLNTVKYFLHIPLDKKAFDALRSCGIEEVPRTIKSLTKTKYYEIQSQILDAAKEENLPAFYFDEFAWAPDEK